MDMHGIIFDVDDTRDDMAQLFFGAYQKLYGEQSSFRNTDVRIAVVPPSAEVHTKEQNTAIMVCIENKYLLFRWKIDRIHIVVGMWHSLVARIVRDDEAAGSNPVIPTIYSTCKDQPMGGSFSVYGEAREISEPCFPHMNVRYV